MLAQSVKMGVSAWGCRGRSVPWSDCFGEGFSSPACFDTGFELCVFAIVVLKISGPSCTILRMVVHGESEVGDRLRRYRKMTSADMRIQYICQRGDSKPTVSVPVSDTLFVPHKIPQNSFESVPHFFIKELCLSSTAFTSFNMCRREDSNLHTLRHTHLKRTWLPITPLRHCCLLFSLQSICASGNLMRRTTCSQQLVPTNYTTPAVALV